MRTQSLLFTSAAVFGMLSISAIPAKVETKQCGVTNEQISAYLQSCSHHHTVYAVWDVPGTCNSKASIENCGIATVYVGNGRVIGHMDETGYCN